MTYLGVVDFRGQCRHGVFGCLLDSLLPWVHVQFERTLLQFDHPSLGDQDSDAVPGSI